MEEGTPPYAVIRSSWIVGVLITVILVLEWVFNCFLRRERYFPKNALGNTIRLRAPIRIEFDSQFPMETVFPFMPPELPGWKFEKENVFNQSGLIIGEYVLLKYVICGWTRDIEAWASTTQVFTDL